MLPLAGVRIVAVEQYGAGPFGTLQLADLGAEIIKVENVAEAGDVYPVRISEALAALRRDTVSALD